MKLAEKIVDEFINQLEGKRKNDKIISISNMIDVLLPIDSEEYKDSVEKIVYKLHELALAESKK